MSFRRRLDRLELLDAPDIPEADLERNLVELDVINRYLGGHRITLEGMGRLTRTPEAKRILEKRPLRVCEIGCGGGDNLLVIDRWAKAKGISLQIIGVDLKEVCTRFARGKDWSFPTQWITGDYKAARMEVPPDILFSSLFCHHFPDADLPGMLQWMHAQAAVGFFINDLHRHPLAYHSIKWLTRAFSRSYLVRNDAPLSVQRSFHKADWEHYLSQAGLDKAQIKWQWAFRWLVIVPK
ncbi:methyltransferase domain-containing protein [Dinghuibacter silviterrae]|uniref:Methyltransferase family protein n=1 Tax=Dinghuibacter silviterrae TaxID=1539049 RepID=A0A4R8DQX9_9BACT|nr:methyltransferase domain-containing protein [Dinghuibacter silviterrae]TDX00226.1 methyltransferase family protein [Dinghuibacter silviterrae]